MSTEVELKSLFRLFLEAVSGTPDAVTRFARGERSANERKGLWGIN